MERFISDLMNGNLSRRVVPITGLRLSPATWPEYWSWHTGLRC